ncbi:M20/M25/M40 family metallo-hydrolase [Dehalobacter sp. DCM]|uniref:M20/M25/M40 family metallo-hydrolase n=1 Tax=Dehalobacter sp. DCM TaxID=2907827 RepID=UPI00308208A4|nr:M20/M25/M40 family metallo-hydrolase [Dehalobacter sp. DCM]
MISRRIFIKIAAGLTAFILPWTALPGICGNVVRNLLGRPAVLFGSDVSEEMIVPSDQTLSRKAMDDITVLAGDDLEGRRAGTAGETRTLVYLESQFKSLGLKSFSGDNYWQLFSIPAMKETVINGRALFRPDANDTLRIPAANIVGGILGENHNKTLILSAHFDHLGIYNGKLYPGANDNASGVACILEVMRRLVKEKREGFRPKINIAAAFWSGEEMGFRGSRYFIQNPLIPLEQIRGVINVDTVAYGAVSDFILWSAGEQSASLITTLKKAARVNGAMIETASGGGHHSDEFAFQGTTVPAVTLLSKEWLTLNHTPEDTAEHINKEKLDMICSVVYKAVRSIAY